MTGEDRSGLSALIEALDDRDVRGWNHVPVKAEHLIAALGRRGFVLSATRASTGAGLSAIWIGEERELTDAGREIVRRMPYWRNSAHDVSDEIVAAIRAVEREARASTGTGLDVELMLAELERFSWGPDGVGTCSWCHWVRGTYPDEAHDAGCPMGTIWRLAAAHPQDPPEPETER